MEREAVMNQEATMDQEAGGARQTVANCGKEVRHVPTRRVGTVSFGITLVCYGILFLTHIFVPMVRYSFIFRCWPVVFILLGLEILVESHKCKSGEWKMIYDFPAVIMLGIMLLFAMVMAAIDFEMAYQTGGVTVFF